MSTEPDVDSDFYQEMAATAKNWGWCALSDVMTERHRQKTAEGFSEATDDGNTRDQLAHAAISYAMPEVWRVFERHGMKDGRAVSVPQEWPPDWDVKWWKPTTRRRDLVKAAALLLAEIERIDRREPRIEINDQDMTRERT